MRLQELSPRQRLAVYTVVPLVLGVVMYLWIQRFLELGVGLRRIIAVAFGLLSLTVGTGSAFYWAMRPSVNDNVRRVGVAWGLGAACGGIVALLWVAGWDELMLIVSGVAIGLWFFGKRHLAKAAAAARHDQAKM